MSLNERSLLEALDGTLRSQAIHAQIDAIVERVKRELASEPTAAMAWEPIPLSVYGEALPTVIRSSWVFILRAGAITGAERHPNSHQRMMSYRATGDLQTRGEGQRQSHPLVSDPVAGMEQRWISVPPNVWHQAVVGDRDWVVVSFHTVPAHELIEERPAAEDASRTHQRHYVVAEQCSMEKVNLSEKLAQFSDLWKPKIVGELNGQQVKLVKFQGPFVWHHHDQEDELFLVVKGRFRVEFRERHVWLEEGEFLIVPHGVEHRPVADEEAHVLLFEPASTRNTGNVKNERTVERLERI
jgi:mannose-6-phosphate isomerase-like protein (cupin superfamily)